ncbi:hypothetical protein OHS33_00555 [Streptomyces sp. NBC_00536]|uniref:hypothetical protein n=1 Tax=Streptomyces sp. NBC_00536 TaxID=2975769 RepID=UPI002E8042D7|nr:hypothetical protein [Streptomyces sp. NBC_00536]WUC76968.1 hypothetical protein OHS33_00555 [Streptomyces sp. NBC_00536]
MAGFEEAALERVRMARGHGVAGSEPRTVRLYEITRLGTGSGAEVRTVEAAEVAAVIQYAGEHGMRVRVRPCTRPHEEHGKEDAS